jgi:hypothetical protein
MGGQYSRPISDGHTKGTESHPAPRIKKKYLDLNYQAKIHLLPVTYKCIYVSQISCLVYSLSVDIWQNNSTSNAMFLSIFLYLVQNIAEGTIYLSQGTFTPHAYSDMSGKGVHSDHILCFKQNLVTFWWLFNDLLHYPMMTCIDRSLRTCAEFVIQGGLYTEQLLGARVASARRNSKEFQSYRPITH